MNGFQRTPIRKRRVNMKYLQLPCNYMEQPSIRMAIREDVAFGELVLLNIILKLGHEFNMGDWRKTGFDFNLVPYAYDMAIHDWYSTCKVKENEHKKFWGLLDNLQKFNVIEYKKTEYSLRIEVPQVAEMTDETNMKKCKNLFGKGRLTADELKLHALKEKDNSGTSLEQIRGENNTLNNTTQDSFSSNKGNSSYSSSPQAPSDKGSEEVNLDQEIDLVQNIVNEITEQKDYEEDNRYRGYVEKLKKLQAKKRSVDEGIPF